MLFFVVVVVVVVVVVFAFLASAVFLRNLRFQQKFSGIPA